jgi:hypothetical protein
MTAHPVWRVVLCGERRFALGQVARFCFARDCPPRLFPGALQHEVMQCRPGIVTVCNGPGSAVHHFVLHRVRDTGSK